MTDAEVMSINVRLVAIESLLALLISALGNSRADLAEIIVPTIRKGLDEALGLSAEEKRALLHEVQHIVDQGRNRTPLWFHVGAGGISEGG